MSASYRGSVHHARHVGVFSCNEPCPDGPRKGEPCQAPKDHKARHVLHATASKEPVFWGPTPVSADAPKADRALSAETTRERAILASLERFEGVTCPVCNDSVESCDRDIECMGVAIRAALKNYRSEGT